MRPAPCTKHNPQNTTHRYKYKKIQTHTTRHNTNTNTTPHTLSYISPYPHHPYHPQSTLSTLSTLSTHPPLSTLSTLAEHFTLSARYMMGIRANLLTPPCNSCISRLAGTGLAREVVVVVMVVVRRHETLARAGLHGAPCTVHTTQHKNTIHDTTQTQTHRYKYKKIQTHNTTHKYNSPHPQHPRHHHHPKPKHSPHTLSYISPHPHHPHHPQSTLSTRRTLRTHHKPQEHTHAFRLITPCSAYAIPVLLLRIAHK
jgi:hypothetical protein